MYVSEVSTTVETKEEKVAREVEKLKHRLEHPKRPQVATNEFTQ